jgi:hypothetical protein
MKFVGESDELDMLWEQERKDIEVENNLPHENPADPPKKRKNYSETSHTKGIFIRCPKDLLPKLPSHGKSAFIIQAIKAAITGEVKNNLPAESPQLMDLVYKLINEFIDRELEIDFTDQQAALLEHIITTELNKHA